MHVCEHVVSFMRHLLQSPLEEVSLSVHGYGRVIEFGYYAELLLDCRTRVGGQRRCYHHVLQCALLFLF